MYRVNIFTGPSRGADKYTTMTLHCKNVVRSPTHCGHTSNRTKCISVSHNVRYFEAWVAQRTDPHKNDQSGKIRQSVLEYPTIRTSSPSCMGSSASRLFKMRCSRAALARIYVCDSCIRQARTSARPKARLIPQRRHISSTGKARQSVAPTLEQLRQPFSKKNASTL